MRPTITTRAQLMDALRLASELEHQLMCQYLFAVYSLKRYPYERLDPYTGEEVLTPAELERIRRWAMKITLIARQEMEHLGLALNLLSSIGGTPSFSRPNMPQQPFYYGEAKIKMELTPGNLATIERFQKFEAPDNLAEWCKLKTDPDPVDQKCAEKWCNQKKKYSREEVYDAIQQDVSGESGKLLAGAPHVDLYGVPYKNVQELYQAIDEGFTAVSQSLGESALFIGNTGNQIYGGPPSPLYGSMNDLNQYGLSLIAVTDLASARQAIRMILEQGEGIRVPPDYLQNTHFCLFSEVRGEMEADKGRLSEICARPVVNNPMVVVQPDVTAPKEVNQITAFETRRVAELSNQSYEVMLLLLLYLYSDQVKTEEQTNALMDAAFFPFMTMFVRPLAEILTELPAYKGWEQLVAKKRPYPTAGPGFELPGDVVLFPNLAQTWTLFQERIDALVLKFRQVTARRPLPPPRGSTGPRDPVKPQWGWVPARDPWRLLPTQKYQVEQRKEMWDKIRRESTTIQPLELEEGLDSFAHASVEQGIDWETAAPPSMPWLRLYYLRQNMERISFDWATNWLQVGRTS